MYIRFVKIGQKLAVVSKIPYAHIWSYSPNMIDFGPLLQNLTAKIF